MLFGWPMCLSGVYLRKENEAKKNPPNCFGGFIF